MATSLISTQTKAAVYEHRQYFTGDMTANQACDQAEREVRRQALAAGLGEIVQSTSFQLCVALEDEEGDCSTQTDLYVQTPSGYVKRFDLISRELAVTQLGQVCVVKADVEVEAFGGKPDPNFNLTAQILPGTLIRDQEELSLQLTKPAGSSVYIFAGRPLKSFSMLVNDDSRMRALDQLYVPSQNDPVRWVVESVMPVKSEERLWVVITRSPVRLPNQINETQLFEQLNQMDRSDWDAVPVSYTILPNEN